MRRNSAAPLRLSRAVSRRRANAVASPSKRLTLRQGHPFFSPDSTQDDARSILHPSNRSGRHSLCSCRLAALAPSDLSALAAPHSAVAESASGKSFSGHFVEGRSPGMPVGMGFVGSPPHLKRATKPLSGHALRCLGSLGRATRTNSAKQ